MKQYTITAERGRPYICQGNSRATFDSVWLSQKCWFSAGCRVTITDENGNSKTYIK